MHSPAEISKIHYWLQGRPKQNFGDFLTEFFLNSLFLPTPGEARGIHLIGSVMDDMFVAADTEADHPVVFWGCGLRTPEGLSPERKAQANILAVRGPLSRSQLRLGALVPFGDPGFLVAALYDPRAASAFAGRSLCIPHFQDQRPDSELIALTGCDLVLRPNIDPRIEAIHQFIDAVAAADFVLTASLHGAVIAAAYRKPFAFWDSGAIDLPFKWEDLAASMGFDCAFQPDLDSARSWYSRVEDQIQLPEAWRLLINPPLLIRPEALLRITRHYIAGSDRHNCSMETFVTAFQGHHASSARFAKRMYQYIKDADEIYLDRNQLAARHEVQQGIHTALQSDRDNLQNAYDHLRADHETLGRLHAALKNNHAETEIRVAALANQHDSDVELTTRQQIQIAEISKCAESLKQDTIKARMQLSRLAASKSAQDDELAALKQDHHDKLNQLQALSRHSQDQDQQLAAKSHALAAVYASTSWRATHRLRRFASCYPASARTLRRAAKLAWWTATWQLGRRLKLRAAIIAEARSTSITMTAAIPTTVCHPHRPAPLPFHFNNPDAPKVLFLDSRYPRTDRDSGSLDTFNTIRLLQSFGYDILFIATAEYHEINAYGAELQKHDVTIITSGQFDSIQTFLKQHGPEITLGILSRVDCGGQFIDDMRRLAPQARVIFNTVDLHHVRQEREAALTNDRQLLNEARRMEERERYLISMADVTFVVSSSDQNRSRTLAPGADVALMPILRIIPGRHVGFSERRGIGFVGGFQHKPNLDAVSYFLEQIWPKVRALLPDAQFHVIGADMPQSMRDLEIPGVEMVGFVPELDPWLDRLRLTVAPLRYGAGAKGKVVSSFSFGVPCVMSTIAAEGMGIDGEAVALLADDPDQFARMVARLYQDPAKWLVLSDACLSLVQSQNSLDRGRAVLRAVLEKLNLPVGKTLLEA
ncbi:glycosyltransferase [Acidisoma cellulosilytica]|uniref:Glycosyltransferase n=1 Tax=Acidisoma cellulosilyticum TaxID=2802395 RepID=A0A964E2G4_9PROT|nr:glycosyltransferase [Acidisoma cellulosilyticum]MCB8879391.1 glycosyltransferase [Acidisoma cellulosilyticum]